MRNEVTESKKLSDIKLKLILHILSVGQFTDLSGIALIFTADSWAKSLSRIMNPHQYVEQSIKEVFGEKIHEKIKQQLNENSNFKQKQLDHQAAMLLYFLMHSLKYEENINYRHASFSNITLLHIIISFGNHDLLSEALSFEAEQIIGGSKKLIPLYYAAIKGDDEAVSDMLKHISKSNDKLIPDIINQSYPYETKFLFYNLLACAVFSGNLKLITYLVQNGAKVEFPAPKKAIFSIFELAFLNQQDNVDVINFLVEQFDLTFDQFMEEEDVYFKVPPLVLAAASGNVNLFTHLLARSDGDLPLLSVSQYLKLMKDLDYFDNHFNNWDILSYYDCLSCFNTKIDLDFIIDTTPVPECKKANKELMKQELKKHLSEKKVEACAQASAVFD